MRCRRSRINNVSLAEGNSGTTSSTFTATLSTASGLPVTVDFATADGAALATSDYQAQTGSLTFNPGQDRKSTRLNSSHTVISYAVFCLKKKRAPIHYDVLHLSVILSRNAL